MGENAGSKFDLDTPGKLSILRRGHTIVLLTSSMDAYVLYTDYFLILFF